MAHLKTNPKIKLPKPSKEELEKSINEIGYRNTDRKYGVCDNTSRRWMLAYGLAPIAKCVLKTRKRKEVVKKDGKFVYKKDGHGITDVVPAPKTKAAKTAVKVDVKSKKEKPAKKEYHKRQVTEPQEQVKKAMTTSGDTQPEPAVKIVVAPPKVQQPRIQHPVIDMSKVKHRYSAGELAEFKTVVDKKMFEAVEDLFQLKEGLSGAGNGTEDTAHSGNSFEDSSAIERELMTERVANKQKQINALKNALIRIGNGTYGICVATGELIPKARLLVAPHTTRCVEAKKEAESGKVVTPADIMAVESMAGNDDDDEEIKPRKFSL